MGDTAVPDIDVIVAVRNGSRFLGEAIESILSQSAMATAIVIDDGSDDGSGAIATGLGPRVRCIAQPPLGLSAARNRGLAESAAPLITFFDADDIMPPRSLEVRRAALLRDHGCDIVFGRTREFLDPELDAGAARRYRVRSDPVRGYLAAAMLARRPVFAGVGPFDPQLGGGEFIDWCLRAREASLRFSEIDDVVLHRRIHGRNMTLTNDAVREGYFKILRRHMAKRDGVAPQSR